MGIEKLRKHFEIIASHPSGIEVFKELIRVCGVNKPATVVGLRTSEVNLIATSHNAALQGIWFTLRDYISPEALISIEYDRKPPEPIKVIGDINHDRSDDSNTDPSDSDISVGGTVRRRRNKFERQSAEFAEQYINNIYPVSGDPSESPDSGGS